MKSDGGGGGTFSGIFGTPSIITTFKLFFFVFFKYDIIIGIISYSQVERINNLTDWNLIYRL